VADRFHKFTDRARRVLTVAQEEAQRFRHNYIGTEHLLLGLLREGDGVAARVLASSGVELANVRSAVEFIIGRGDQPVVGQVGLTPRVKKVIELAVDEAQRLGHPYIGTEHLLLGMLREGEGIAAGVLLSFGLTLDHLRSQTLATLGEQPAPGEQSTLPPSSPLPARGRVMPSSFSMHLRPTPDTGGPYVEPALEDLVGVIPVAQTQRCAGVDVTILSVELYTDGFLVNVRLLFDPNAGSPLSPQARPLFPAFEAEDDRGTRFTGRPSFGSSGVGRQARYLYRFTPQLDRSARELRLRCTELRWREPGRARSEAATVGPCAFSISLGDRPASEAMGPDR
jgi:hypothetical protein